MESEEATALLRSGSAAEEQQQLPEGWLEKPHVCAALQGLSPEQRETAIQGQAAWRERFAEAKWKPVMDGLDKFAREDNLRIAVTPARPLLPTSSSAPAVPLVGQRPVTLHRLNTASPNLVMARHATPPTPRARWDVVSSSQASPLSPKPVGNAFAEGGFWESLTTQAQTPVPQTPITAATLEPWSPIVPNDPEGKAKYNEVKRSADSMALKICASRLSIHSTLSDNGYVHPSMIKPKDALHGAEFILHSIQQKLRTQLDTELPKKMEQIADDEVAAVQQYSIMNTLELLNINTWLQVDEKTLEMTTILDAQRELLRMSQKRRQTKELNISNQAVQLAWAVKVLDDTERMVEINGDCSSVDSEEDQGYDYSNFLRSIKREVSGNLASIVEDPIGDIGSLRSSSTTASSDITQSREASLSQRMSPGPKIPYNITSRAREDIISSSECGLKRTTHATGKRRNITIATNLVEQQEEDEDVPTPISPEDKVFRHQGPSFTDLTNWAQELKKMAIDRGETRSNRSSVSSSTSRVHPAFRSPQHSREDSTSSAHSWKCKTAARHEREFTEGSAETQVSNTSGPLPQLLEVPPTPTSPSQRSPTRSRSFYEREQFTGLIPLPPASSTAYNRQAATSAERLSSIQLQPPSSDDSPTPASSPSKHQRTSSTDSLHKAVRRQQHIRSRSSLSIPPQEENDWMKELKRMESREKIRQIEQLAMRKAGGLGDGSGDEGDEEGEIGIAL